MSFNTTLTVQHRPFFDLQHGHGKMAEDGTHKAETSLAREAGVKEEDGLIGVGSLSLREDLAVLYGRAWNLHCSNGRVF